LPVILAIDLINNKNKAAKFLGIGMTINNADYCTRHIARLKVRRAWKVDV